MELILSAFIPLVLMLVFVPLSIPISNYFGLVDDPKKRPHPAHVHRRIVPRAGGIPIFFGILCSVLLLIPLDNKIIGILIGSAILLIIGLLDDKLKTFNPYLRLILLFIAAAFPVIAGVGISFITNPLALLSFLNPNWGSSYIRLDQIVIPISIFGSHQILLIADILAFVWIVTLTQVINWSKGVDGQMPGITFIAALTLGFLSFKFSQNGDINQFNLAKLAFITAGTSLGFLIFNWYPAKIFPGFSGSTILAFLLANLAILSGAKLATAILVLAVPSADFIYTFFRRMAQGRSPVWGDRGHLHHKLLDLGWSHQSISLFYIFGSAILGLLAIFVDIQGKAFLVLGILIVLLGAILWLNSFGDLSKPSDPDNG